MASTSYGAIIPPPAYFPVTSILLIGKVEKAEGECGPGAEAARHRNRPSMQLHNGFCQRQAQSNAMNVLRKPAAVETLKDVV